jgi:Arginine methyltransferase-interacting protein, contains RING Zn-finger
MDIMNAIHLLAKEVNEVKEAVKAPKTYAQVAASTTNNLKKPQLSPEKKNQLEQAKKERSLYEITINTKNASAETNKSLSTSLAKDVTAKLQKVINRGEPEGKPVLLGINRLGTTALKLHFRTKEEAAKAKALGIDWSQAYEGLETRKPQYGIVVHGVPTELIDSNETTENIIEQWEQDNAQCDIKITRITPLRRNVKHKPTAHKSMVVYMESAEAANNCILRGFMSENQRLKAEKYAPNLHINQCYKCHGFGHRSTTCKRKEKCGRCGKEDHTTNECNAEEPHCANCEGKHEAWHRECDKRSEEGRRLHQMRTEASALFST